MSKRKPKKSKLYLLSPYEHLRRLVQPLLEMFSVLDDVFTEEDAFSNEKIKTSLGRIYRAWKKVRTIMDPDFDSERWRHNRRRKGMRGGN